MPKIENVITGITGYKGSFKTTFLTYLLKSESELKPTNTIYNNYKVTFPFKYLNATELIINKEMFVNTTIGIDELHEYADSRNSGSLQNRLVSGFFLQSRHTNSNIYYSTQFIDQIDKRIRRITDVEIFVENAHIDSDNDGDDDIAYAMIIDYRYHTTNRITFYAKPIFDMFDSSERINPFILSKEKMKEIVKTLELQNEEKINSNK
jgi:hypothetical protein